MPKYFGSSSLLLLVGMVIARVLIIKNHGKEAVKFGKIDKSDFIIPPFALFFFYIIFAHSFSLPTIAHTTLFQSAGIEWVGVGFCILGVFNLLWSLISFRNSFRIGIDEKTDDALITTGIFAISRNPIYLSFASVLTGQFLIFPNWIIAVYLPCAFALFHRQVSLEEAFLKERYREEFVEYCKRVRRYF